MAIRALSQKLRAAEVRVEQAEAQLHNNMPTPMSSASVEEHSRSTASNKVFDSHIPNYFQQKEDESDDDDDDDRRASHAFAQQPEYDS